MTMTMTMAMPVGWRQIEAGPNAERDIAEAVDSAYAKADRDSSAVAKHWMRERLTAALQPEQAMEETIVAIAYPEAPIAGVVLPVSATILQLAITSTNTESAMETLALIAAGEPSGHIMTTDVGVVLRAHHVRDVKSTFEEEVAGAPITPSEREEILTDVNEMPSLRARYVVPSVNGERWYAVAFSAMLGTDEAELVNTYLELFDAFIQTIAVRQDS